MLKGNNKKESRRIRHLTNKALSKLLERSTVRGLEIDALSCGTREDHEASSWLRIWASHAITPEWCLEWPVRTPEVIVLCKMLSSPLILITIPSRSRFIMVLSLKPPSVDANALIAINRESKNATSRRETLCGRYSLIVAIKYSVPLRDSKRTTQSFDN